MSNIKEYFKQLDAILAVKELDDEVAATCSGGRVIIGGLNPDIILRDDEAPRSLELPRRGELRINASIGEGIPNLAKYQFNDVTDSISIGQGTWAFYKDENYRGQSVIRKPGSLPLLGPLKNSISSLRRIG